MRTGRRTARGVTRTLTESHRIPPESSSGAGSSAIEIGDITVDTAAKLVSRNEEAMPLTAREYRLVEYLALHRGCVVSRTELYEHLFDENEDTLSNLLDVHVSNVRKKLGASIISTRRGHGYCIE